MLELRRLKQHMLDKKFKKRKNEKKRRKRVEDGETWLYDAKIRSSQKRKRARRTRILFVSRQPKSLVVFLFLPNLK